MRKNRQWKIVQPIRICFEIVVEVSCVLLMETHFLLNSFPLYVLTYRRFAYGCLWVLSNTNMGNKMEIKKKTFFFLLPFIGNTNWGIVDMVLEFIMDLLLFHRYDNRILFPFSFKLWCAEEEQHHRYMRMRNLPMLSGEFNRLNCHKNERWRNRDIYRFIAICFYSVFCNQIKITFTLLLLPFGRAIASFC